MSKGWVNALSHDLWRLILQRLRPSVLVRTGYLCKTLMAVAQDNKTWESHKHRLTSIDSLLGASLCEGEQNLWSLIGHILLSKDVFTLLEKKILTDSQWIAYFKVYGWRMFYQAHPISEIIVRMNIEISESSPPIRVYCFQISTYHGGSRRSVGIRIHSNRWNDLDLSRFHQLIDQ